MPVVPQKIDREAVRPRLNLHNQPRPQLDPLRRIYQAFEHRLLHPLPKIHAQLRHPPQPDRSLPPPASISTISRARNSTHCAASTRHSNTDFCTLCPKSTHSFATRRSLRLPRSEEHTSELQSLRHLVCRLL